MAKYTICICDLKRNGFDFGLKDYQLTDESYREKLNTKILQHYWIREIGFETEELFKYFLNVKMNEIMPFYDKLYESEKLKIEPLLTQNIETNATGKTDGTSNIVNEVSSSDKGKSAYNDTPMSNVQNPLDGKYLTDITGTENNSNTDSTSETNTETNTDTSQTIKGFSGNQSEMLLKYRETFLNIDMMIINELNDLFMGMW